MNTKTSINNFLFICVILNFFHQSLKVFSVQIFPPAILVKFVLKYCLVLMLGNGIFFYDFLFRYFIVSIQKLNLFLYVDFEFYNYTELLNYRFFFLLVDFLCIKSYHLKTDIFAFFPKCRYLLFFFMPKFSSQDFQFYAE